MKYVAHPYSGKNCNKLKVEEIIKELVLEDKTTTYVSPIHSFGFMYDFVETYEQGMKMCLDLLDKCEELILCPNWENSKGCRMEHDFAVKNKIKITFLDKV